MFFSKSCEYGIKAVIFIGSRSSSSEKVRVNDIARNINSPLAFTAKILQALVGGQIVSSSRGIHGGFWIDPEALSSITVMDIVKVIDGDAMFHQCALGMDQCGGDHPCPIHHRMVGVRGDIARELESTTLEELVESIDSGFSFLQD